MRLSDEPLRVAIVGEFSSGKSTLINTVIGTELLATDVLPATTASPTLVKFGDQLKAHAYFRESPRGPYLFHGRTFWDRLDGLCDRPDLRMDRRELLKTFIRVATVDEAVASLLESVVITVPSAYRDAGLEFIDTPGINAELERHESVSAMVVRELCDTAFVTIPAENALSRSLLQFLQQHMVAMLPRCVFVITRMDLRRPDERHAIIANVAARLRRELDLHNPLILLAPPPTASSSFVEDDPLEVGRTDEVAVFCQHLYAVLNTNRNLLRAAHAAIRLSGVLADIRTALRGHAEQQRTATVDHQGSSSTDALIMLDKAQRLSHQSIRERVRHQRARLMKEVDSLRSSTRTRLWQRVHACDSQDAVRALPNWVTTSVATPTFERLTKELESAVVALVEGVEDRLKSTLDSCRQAIESTAGCDTAAQPSTTALTQLADSPLASRHVSLATELGELDSMASNASIVGAVATAGLACILTGGLAAPALIFGGLLGGSLGKRMFSKPSDALKSQCFHKLWAGLSSQLDSFAEHTETSLDKLEREAIARADAVINTHRQIVNAAKQAAEKRVQQARHTLERLTQELMLLEQLKGRLDEDISGTALKTDPAWDMGYADV